MKRCTGQARRRVRRKPPRSRSPSRWGCPRSPASWTTATTRNLEGGVLESFGRLFRSNVKVYAYPQRDEQSGGTLTLDDLDASGPLRHLQDFLIETGRLEPIRNFNAGCLGVRADVVRAQIEAGDCAWESAVPAAVARTIKRDRLFGCQARS